MSSSDSFVASIEPWPGSYAPPGWSFCFGQQLPIQENEALFATMSNVFGGDGTTSFALPDMRGRVPVGTGLRPGSDFNFELGHKGGKEGAVLTINQMPPHTHAAYFSTEDSSIDGYVALPLLSGLGAGSNNPTDGYFGGSGGTKLFYSDFTKGAAMAKIPVTISGIWNEGKVEVDNTGKAVPVYLIQPYSVLNYIICVQGNYPPRS